MAIKREELPAEVEDFYEDAALLDNIFDILERYQVDPDKSGDIIFIIESENEQGQVYDQSLFPKVPSRLQELTGLDAEKSKQLAVELVGAWLLPIEGYVGNVSGLIKEWGGRVEDFSVKRIGRQDNLTPDLFIKQFVEKRGVVYKDAAMQRRLAYILVTMVRGVRTPIDAQRALSRATKVGGLNMEEDKAKQIVKKLKADLSDVSFSEAVESKDPKLVKASVLPKSVKPPSLPKPPKPPEAKVPPKRKLPPVPEKIREPENKQSESQFDPMVIAEEGQVEAKQVVKKVSKVPEVISFEQAADQVLGLLPELSKDQAMKKRLRLVIDSRLKDVRDAYATRTILEESKTTGGLELSGRTLVRALEVIEAMYDKTHQGAALEQDKKLEKYKANQIKKKEVQAKKKEVELDQRFLKITGKPAVASPKPAEASLSSASVEQSRNKPAVNDVLPQRRLAGPIEELAGFELTSFRRLSADPEAAIKKIKDKIDLLEKDSYTKKLEGVKAWLDSPINKMYVALSRQALVSGKPIEQVIAAEESEKKVVLNPQEVLAIMKLNQRLRF